MSDYGPAFEFLDSRAGARWTEGHYRAKSDSTLQLGSLVTVDFADAGYLKAAPAASTIVPKVTGLLLQELQFEDDPWGPDPRFKDTYSYGKVHPGRLAIITGGAGVKIRVKNVAGVTRSDGRVISAVTMYDATSITAGSAVKWDGSKYVHTASDDAVATAIDISSAGLVLALLG